MLDLHVHVWPHHPGTPTPTFEQLERYCEAAASKGISQIAITEHSYRFARILNDVVPQWDRPTTGATAEATSHVLEVEGAADLDAYVSALQDAQSAGLPLLIGLEVDYLAGAMPAMAEVLGDYPFDVLLGSVHWLDEWLFDDYGTEAFASQWEERNVDEVFSQYVDSVLDLAHTEVVDVLAHLDVIKVAGHRATRLSEHEHRLVEGLSDTNLVVEFSSAGLRKPVADTYPSLTLLDALLEAGMSLTTASDAHSVEQIGLGFDRLEQALNTRGIDTLVSFSRREQVVHRR
ncbi:MAG: histidinol-phosphatase [Acidimicrobiales bacterium]